MAFPSDLTRTKNWGTEILTDTDLEGQFDLIINWVMAALDPSTGHSHSGSGNNSQKISSSGVTATFTNGFTTVTGASGDYVQIADVSDSNNTKKALISDIVTLATPTAATQAEMEAASSTTVMATPGRAQYHPGVAKAWILYDGNANTITASHNVSSVTDNGTGDYTINFTTAFSSTAYAAVGTAYDTGLPAVCHVYNKTRSVGSLRVETQRYDTGGLVDAEFLDMNFFGDQ